MYKCVKACFAAATLILGIAGMGSGLAYGQYATATTPPANGGFVDLDNVVQARARTVTACNRDDDSCPSYVINPDDLRGNLMGLPVVYANTMEARSEAAFCSDNVTRGKTPNDLSGVVLTSAGREGGVCSLAFTKLSENEISISAGVKRSRDIKADFPIRYQSMTGLEEFSGDEKLSSGSVTYDLHDLIVKGVFKDNR